MRQLPSGSIRPGAKLCAILSGLFLDMMKQISWREERRTWRKAFRDPKLYYTKRSRRSPETPGKLSSNIARPVSAALAIRRSAQETLSAGTNPKKSGTAQLNSSTTNNVIATVATWPVSSAAK